MGEDAIRLMSLADELESFIRSVVPKSTLVSKYGGTLFTLKPEEKEGQFCGVFVYKTHVQISFSKGAQLKDAKKLLSGSGKLRRHINLRSMDDINQKELKTLLRQSAKM